MSPTIDFELVFIAAGVLLTVVAASLHSLNLGLAGILIAILAAGAALLDRRP
jgi:hypothetical protein